MTAICVWSFFFCFDSGFCIEAFLYILVEQPLPKLEITDGDDDSTTDGSGVGRRRGTAGPKAFADSRTGASGAEKK